MLIPNTGHVILKPITVKEEVVTGNLSFGEDEHESFIEKVEIVTASTELKEKYENYKFAYIPKLLGKTIIVNNQQLIIAADFEVIAFGN